MVIVSEDVDSSVKLLDGVYEVVRAAGVIATLLLPY